MKASPTRTIILVFSFFATGCATSTKSSLKSADLLPAPAPSYDEKVQTVAADKFTGGTCPADSTVWETADYKKLVPSVSACAKAHDWVKVEKMANYLASHSPLTPWGAYFLALSANARKDYPRASWMLELALKKDPREGLFHYQLARISWDLHEDADAIAHMKTASDLSPSLYQAHWVMGELSAQKQDLSAAESYFKKALTANPQHLPSLLAMASLKMNAKEWEKAESYLAQAVNVEPRSTKARVALAQVQEEHLRKLPEALATYKTLKTLSLEQKLDDSVHFNLDEKIQVLEKNLAAANKGSQESGRTPSGEKQVAK